MNFGGVHFIAGMFFIVLSCLLVTVWLWILFLMISCFIRFFRWIFGKADRRPFGSMFKKNALTALMISMLLHIGVYTQNRFEWFGPENANLKAKEYYVAGQPLAGFRLILSRFLNPDNPALFFLNGLQELIYSQGIKQLPENDGEIGVWTDMWFTYPYIGVSHEPYGTSKTQPSQGMRKLLDRIWFAMEAMNTMPFADKRMESQYYRLNFPSMAFYYVLNDGYYHDRMIGSAFYLVQKPSYINRTRLLCKWLVDLRRQWIEQGRYGIIKNNYPKVEALRQASVLCELISLIRSSIYSGRFTCSNSDLTFYVQARREFIDESSPNHVLKRLRFKEPQQAMTLYGISAKSVSAGFMKYLLNKYCGIDVPGAMDRGYKNKKAEKNANDQLLESVFHEEIKLLKEMYDD